MSYTSYEFLPELEGEYGYEFSENELADELLALQSEGELDHFLGSLLSTAWRGAKALYNSPIGQAVKRQAISGLKSVGRQVLPSLGRTVGGYLGGRTGARMGSSLGRAAAGRFLGQEFEGAPPEGRAYETARRLVSTTRLAARDIGRYLQANGTATRRAIRGIIMKAARRYFPGLPPYRIGITGTPTSPPAYASTVPAGPRPRAPYSKTQGTWYRKGRRIVVNLA